MRKRERETAQSGNIEESDVQEMRKRMDTLYNEETRLIDQREDINRRLREIEEEKMEVHI